MSTDQNNWDARKAESGTTPQAGDVQSSVETAASGPAASQEAAAGFAVSLPEDLRAPWGWRELLLFFLVAVGGIVLINIVAVVVVLGLRIPLKHLETFPLKAYVVTATNLTLFAVLMLFLLALVRGKYKAPFWRTIGWRALRPKEMAPAGAVVLLLMGGVGLALAVGVLSYFVRPKTKLPIEALLEHRTGALMLMAMAVLVAPIVEETVFRGYIYPVLARSFGVAGGVIVTGVLFGGLHAFQLWGGWGQIALIMLVGVVLTWVRASTGTVFASFLMHLSYNSVFSAILYAGTGGLRNFPAPGQ